MSKIINRKEELRSKILLPCAIIQIILSLIHGKNISTSTHRKLFRGDVRNTKALIRTNSPTSLLTEEHTQAINISQSNSFLEPSPMPSPIFTSTPSNLELAMNQTHLAGHNDLKLEERCTKQLMYFQGDNLGVIAGENIKILQKTVKSELNKVFTRDVDRAQIVNVTIIDQLFDPQLPQEIAMVVLIQGSFSIDETFSFDTEVQKMFDDISGDMLIQLKENIGTFSDVTALFSVIDWNSNPPGEQCGITTPILISSLKPSLVPSPMPSLMPSAILSSTPSITINTTHLIGYNDLELVERCTKQLLYLQGDNIGIITDDDIQLLQQILKSELNKIFTRDAGRAQILEVTVLDQLSDPQLPRDVTIVTLIEGSFPDIKDFIFATKVQQIFDAVSSIMLIELTENIDKYSGVTNLFLVADWSLNAPEVQCKKKDENKPEESQSESEFDQNLVYQQYFIMIGIAGFILCFCVPACVVQHRINRNN